MERITKCKMCPRDSAADPLRTTRCARGAGQVSIPVLFQPQVTDCCFTNSWGEQSTINPTLGMLLALKFPRLFPDRFLKQLEMTWDAAFLLKLSGVQETCTTHYSHITKAEKSSRKEEHKEMCTEVCSSIVMLDPCLSIYVTAPSGESLCKEHG